MKQPYIRIISFVITVAFWWQKTGKPQCPGSSCCTESQGDTSAAGCPCTRHKAGTRRTSPHRLQLPLGKLHISFIPPDQMTTAAQSYQLKMETWAVVRATLARQGLAFPSCSILRYCLSLQDWAARAMGRNVQPLSSNAGECCVGHLCSTLLAVTSYWILLFWAPA